MPIDIDIDRKAWLGYSLVLTQKRMNERRTLAATVRVSVAETSLFPMVHHY